MTTVHDPWSGPRPTEPSAEEEQAHIVIGFSIGIVIALAMWTVVVVALVRSL